MFSDSDDELLLKESRSSFTETAVLLGALWLDKGSTYGLVEYSVGSIFPAVSSFENCTARSFWRLNVVVSFCFCVWQ